MRGLLSVIIPSYNEEEMLPLAVSAIGTVLESAEIPYELVCVDDGSTDRTWAEIEKSSADCSSIHGISGAP